MGLTVKQQKTLDYCRHPRTSEQVASYLGIELNGVYKHLIVLQRLGLLEKVAEHANSKAIYQAADLGGISIDRHLDELVSASQGYITRKGPAAHNPFNL
jgi:predicted ArsR family transcriptional regulator